MALKVIVNPVENKRNHAIHSKGYMGHDQDAIE